MKLLYPLSIVVLLAGCSTSQYFVNVPAKQAVKVDIPVKENVEVDLKNRSLKDVEVKVLQPTTGEVVSGFGLGPKAKATVFVAKGNILQLGNASGTNSKVNYIYRSTSPPAEITNLGGYISFTLANKSAKSIPLIIPSVMNPNLSPFSRSGVDLKVGQKIFFKQKGKRYLLLEVTNAIEEGAVIEVANLLKERKAALGV